jgi:hypothetical protein
MASSRIALVILISLLTATAAFSQDAQKEQTTPQTPVSASPVLNQSTPKAEEHPRRWERRFGKPYPSG